MCIKMKDGVADETIHSIERMPVESMHTPAGAGYRNAIHYAQIIKNKKFQRFDYGKDENMIKYGCENPPEYDLSKIEVKMAIATGDVDQLSNPVDDEWLLNQSQSGLNVKDKVIFHK